MTGRLVAVAVANLLMLALGTGLLPLFGLARTPRRLLTGLPLAYALGVAATGILAADLTLVRVPVGRIALPLLAVASLGLGLRRLERGVTAQRTRLLRKLPALAVLAVAVAFLVEAARLFAVKPLWETDAWTAIWTLRARALYDFGHRARRSLHRELRSYPGVAAPALAAGARGGRLPLPHALGYDRHARATCRSSGSAVAFVGGAWVLLRRHAPPLLLAGALLAILTAPTFFNQIETSLGRRPAGDAASRSASRPWRRVGAEWGGPGCCRRRRSFSARARSRSRRGELFALAAFARRGARRTARAAEPLALAAAGLAAAAIDLPWRIWLKSSTT